MRYALWAHHLHQLAADEFAISRWNCLREFLTAHRPIEQLAEESAGSVFVVAGENELDGIYQRVAAELRLIYSLAYSSTNTSRDGKFRKINVAVKQEGAVVRTRRGYVSR